MSNVQNVRTCSKLLVSKQCYAENLQLHNCTVYVSNNKDVHSYVWHEGRGTFTASAFTSHTVGFIRRKVQYKKIVSIPGDCAYQNKKNKLLASALSDVSLKINIGIDQIILEKGPL